MNKNEKFGCLITVIRLLITLPLTYVLTFMILKRVDATETMWLIYWIGTPLSIALSILFEVGNQIINPKEK